MAQIALVFQQQIACAFKNDFIVLGLIVLLDVAYFIDDPAKSCNDHDPDPDCKSEV